MIHYCSAARWCCMHAVSNNKNWLLISHYCGNTVMPINLLLPTRVEKGFFCIGMFFYWKFTMVMIPWWFRHGYLILVFLTCVVFGQPFIPEKTITHSEYLPYSSKEMQELQTVYQRCYFVLTFDFNSVQTSSILGVLGQNCHIIFLICLLNAACTWLFSAIMLTFFIICIHFCVNYDLFDSWRNWEFIKYM